ncbi:MAG: hypothetical protein ACTSRI_09315 [Promethearchaeota archaeon]
MGVDFIIILENILNKSQEEINQKFGVISIKTKTGLIELPNWKTFSYMGKNYCSWMVCGRYFKIHKYPDKWEQIRQIIVKTREFLGSGKVYVGNDVIYSSCYEEGDSNFFLPPELEEKYLINPKN